MTKVLIVGGHDSCPLTSAKIAELSAQIPDVQVVSLEEAQRKGLCQTFEYKAPPPLPEIPRLIGFSDTGARSRNARRKAERESKKRKKR